MGDHRTASRVERFAALGDPARLAIIDELARSDRAPIELQQIVQAPSNLLAHHLEVLERVGLISRHRSSGDGRRRYIHLERDAFEQLLPGCTVRPGRALFVCTHNSARSQLAAALWESVLGESAQSAGTHPADRIHPGAIAAGKRVGLDLTGRHPARLDQISVLPPTVITVCDRAHEELEPHADWLHWSIPDPVITGTRAAFDAVVHELDTRIKALAGPVAA